jgi:hypothetical protein
MVNWRSSTHSMTEKRRVFEPIAIYSQLARMVAFSQEVRDLE